MTLTKAILTTELTNALGLSKPEAQTVVEAFFEEMSEALVSSDDIKLANLCVSRFARRPKGEDEIRKRGRIKSSPPIELCPSTRVEN